MRKEEITQQELADCFIWSAYSCVCVTAMTNSWSSPPAQLQNGFLGELVSWQKFKILLMYPRGLLTGGHDEVCAVPLKGQNTGQAAYMLEN